MLKKLKQNIDEAIAEFLLEKHDLFSLSSGKKHLSLPIDDFVRREGKKIRPLLFMLSYMGYTSRKDIDLKALARYALSFELAHDYLLVHDDIIDRSDTRRGKPSMHRMYNDRLNKDKEDRAGYNLAIVAGDIIHSLSVRNLFFFPEENERLIRAAGIFLDETALTAKGEFIDVVNDLEPIEKLDEKDIIEMYLLKTASYTCRLPIIVGAVLAGNEKKEEHFLIEKFSSDLGLAFQMQDDLLDIYMPEKKTGKKALTDLSESKKTLLAQKAYSLLAPAEKKTFAQIFKKDKKTEKELLQLKALLRSTPAGAWCLKKTKSYLASANRTLKELNMDLRFKDRIEDLAKSVFSSLQSIEENMGAKCK